MAVDKQRELDTSGPGAVDQACAALLKELRARCPGLVPADPLPPSGVGAVVPVTPAALGPLVVTAAGQALPSARTGGAAPDAVLWQQGVDALLVRITAITTAVGDGWVTVSIPVTCDQIRDPAGAAPIQPVTVTFVMGTADRPAALFAAAISALEQDGWKVSRVAGSGKSSVRRITKGKDSNASPVPEYHIDTACWVQPRR